MALALREKQAYNECEVVVERPNGNTCTVLAHANPFFDETGRLVGAVNILVDISERKRAEAAERESNRRKSEFLAMLAHELRNPLAPIRNAVQVLRLGRDDEDAAQAVEMLERQIGQMVRLVDDLLDMGRIDQGVIEVRKQCIELASVIDHALEAAGPLCKDKNHELTVHVLV